MSRVVADPEPIHVPLTSLVPDAEGLAALAAAPVHARPVADVVAAASVDPAAGLGDAEVVRRRDLVGPNRLPEAPRRHPLLRLLDQFREPLIALLLLAGVVALLIGETIDAVAILVVVTLNAILGWVQELNAERQVDALRTLVRDEVRVRRGGVVEHHLADDLVPGDVVLLEAGDRVPADGRLLVAERAEVEEAALTGESVPVGKAVAPTEEDVPLGDRHSVAFSGTHVSRGRMELLVTATGPRTELGRLAALVDEHGGTTSPLHRQLADLGKRLSFVALVAVVVLAGLGLLRGQPLAQVAIEAVAVAAAALPEGLPTAVTVTLALAVGAMARRQAVVRGLPAVETLGATSVICTDKTGTLTAQQLQVVEAYVDGRRVAIDDPALSPALRAFVLSSDAAVGADGYVGDPTETALLDAASAAGLDVGAVRDEVRRVAEDPFDPTTRRMTVVVVHPDGSRQVLAKGAPEALAVAGAAPSGPVEALADRALRTLAVAGRELRPDEDADDAEALLHDLRPLGLVALADPLRPTAADTVAAAHRAGVQVVMLTGDHLATARAIATDAGIVTDGTALEGRDLRDLDDAALDEMVGDLAVVARVAPDDKLRVVQAFQRRGHVVAVTGDGANDAAALRAAEVGVALGSGTDVAREAADVVLLDDDLGTLMRAVERGRAMHDNLRTFLRFQLTTNASLVLALVAASLAGLAAPMTAAQVLWVNLVADGPPAVALGVDPPRPGVLDRGPRDPRASLLDRELWSAVLPAALVMAAAALAAQVLVETRLVAGGATTQDAAAVATTVAFTGFVLAQVANAFVVRQSGRSVLHRPARNPFLSGSLLLVVLLQVAIVHVPALGEVARTVPLDGGQWAVAVCVALVWPLVRELDHLVRRAVRAVRREGASA
ncbi:cation-transporting P-type ATPase [Nitriliruptoraceae bacterium ZYF776]|nr:cation-transporting P-type ATPase [Profundirhabdus halotolerans]